LFWTTNAGIAVPSPPALCQPDLDVCNLHENLEVIMGRNGGRIVAAERMQPYHNDKHHQKSDQEESQHRKSQWVKTRTDENSE
jgi:hypothetical protein